jgi:two-component system sensor histidine kinase/response regulator
MSELDRLRTRFGQFLVILIWLHVPVVTFVAMAVNRPLAPSALAAILLASAYHLSWWRHGIGPVTRYLSAVVLMGQPALWSRWPQIAGLVTVTGVSETI